MSGGEVLDLVLVLLALVAALSGARRGFVLGAASLVGLVAGAALGAWLAPGLLAGAGVGRGAPVLALLVVLLLAAVGQVAASAAGAALRARLADGASRVVDAAAGAALSLAGVTVVVWFLASVAVAGPYPSLAAAVRGSTVLGAVDAGVPDAARTAFSSLRRSVEAGAPRVFAGLRAPDVPEVDPGDEALAASPALDAARAATVEVRGLAPSCGRSLSGSGFVYAPGKVMTNAHVVAGVVAPEVATEGGEDLDAEVVVLDVASDLAVLDVPGLDVAPLALGGSASPGDDVVALGYPGGGGLQASAGRVRARVSARGPDARNERIVVRDVYSVRVDVRPGSSGGPLLTPAGGVVGVVFAAAAEPQEGPTGYALTASEAAPVADAGLRSTTAVPTGACA